MYYNSVGCAYSQIPDIRDRQNKASIASADTAVWNPAFDITPNEYITAIITEVIITLATDGYNSTLREQIRFDNLLLRYSLLSMESFGVPISRKVYRR